LQQFAKYFYFKVKAEICNGILQQFFQLLDILNVFFMAVKLLFIAVFSL